MGTRVALMIRGGSISERVTSAKLVPPIKANDKERNQKRKRVPESVFFKDMARVKGGFI
jgi:hypothetical protein